MLAVATVFLKWLPLLQNLIVLAMHNAYLLLSFILSINIVYNYHTIDFSIFYYFVLLKLRSETYSKQTYNKYDRYTYDINITYRYTYKQYIQNLFLPPLENVWT